MLVPVLGASVFQDAEMFNLGARDAIAFRRIVDNTNASLERQVDAAGLALVADAVRVELGRDGKQPPGIHLVIA